MASAGRPIRRFADEHGARWRDRLESRGGIDHVARNHALVSGTQRDRRLAGEHSGSRLDLRPQRGDRIDQLERSPNGAFSVILVGYRRAPYGHDRVTDVLLDGPAVARDDLGAQLEVARQRLAHLFGDRVPRQTA